MFSLSEIAFYQLIQLRSAKQIIDKDCPQGVVGNNMQHP